VTGNRGGGGEVAPNYVDLLSAIHDAFETAAPFISATVSIELSNADHYILKDDVSIVRSSRHYFNQGLTINIL
jgi:hypothetical protein